MIGSWTRPESLKSHSPFWKIPDRLTSVQSCAEPLAKEASKETPKIQIFWHAGARGAFRVSIQGFDACPTRPNISAPLRASSSTITNDRLWAKWKLIIVFKNSVIEWRWLQRATSVTLATIVTSGLRKKYWPGLLLASPRLAILKFGYAWLSRMKIMSSKTVLQVCCHLWMHRRLQIRARPMARKTRYANFLKMPRNRALFSKTSLLILALRGLRHFGIVKVCARQATRCSSLMPTTWFSVKLPKQLRNWRNSCQRGPSAFKSNFQVVLRRIEVKFFGPTPIGLSMESCMSTHRTAKPILKLCGPLSDGFQGVWDLATEIRKSTWKTRSCWSELSKKNPTMSDRFFISHSRTRMQAVMRKRSSGRQNGRRCDAGSKRLSTVPSKLQSWPSPKIGHGKRTNCVHSESRVCRPTLSIVGVRPHGPKNCLRWLCRRPRFSSPRKPNYFSRKTFTTGKFTTSCPSLHSRLNTKMCLCKHAKNSWPKRSSPPAENRGFVPIWNFRKPKQNDFNFTFWGIGDAFDFWEKYFPRYHTNQSFVGT